MRVLIFTLICLCLTFSEARLPETDSELTDAEIVEPLIAPSYAGRPVTELGRRSRQDLFNHLQRTGRLDPPNPHGTQSRTAEVNPAWRTQARLVAIARCDPNSGEYEMLIYKDGVICRRWPTSPGRQASGPDGPMWTDLSDAPGGSGGNQIRATTRRHEVSQNKSYAGAVMENVLWIGQRNGYAIHCLPGTSYHSDLGHPASSGCLRLRCDHANELYQAVQRVGTENMRVYFAGYDCENSTIQAQPQQRLVRGLLNRTHRIRQSQQENHCRNLY